MSRGRLLAAAYVVTVATLTAVAFVDEDHERWWARIAAAVLCLPTIVPALPAIYVGGAIAWSFADDPSSGSASSSGPEVDHSPIWPVTLAFTAMMTAVAMANVLVWRALGRRVTSRLDRPVLLSSLVSGGLWLLLLVPRSETDDPGSWLLLVVGMTYVVAASLGVAAVHGRGALTRYDAAAAWLVAWLTAVATWMVLLGGTDTGPATWGLGMVVGTACFAAWQAVAWLIRQTLRGAGPAPSRTRSGSSPAPAHPAPAASNPRRPG